jgi:hypothetical protein
VLDGKNVNLEKAHDFTNPSSDFYPQCEAAIRARIDNWYSIDEADEEPDDE